MSAQDKKNFDQLQDSQSLTQTVKNEENLKIKDQQTPKFDLTNLEEMSDMLDSDLDEFDDSSSDSSTEDLNSSVLVLSKNQTLRQSITAIFDDASSSESSSINQILTPVNKLIKHSSVSADFSSMLKSSISKLNLEDTQKIVVDLLNERENFRQRLDKAKSVVIDTQDQLEKLKQMSDCLPKANSKSGIHLAFLFSSPLVRESGYRLENVMQLDYNSEIKDVLKLLSFVSLKYRTNVATVSNFRSTLTDSPMVLHFSGHGIENTRENLGSSYAFNSDKGNILLLEDEKGMSKYLFEEELKYMLKLSKNVFEVVFVSS